MHPTPDTHTHTEHSIQYAIQMQFHEWSHLGNPCAPLLQLHIPYWEGGSVINSRSDKMGWTHCHRALQSSVNHKVTVCIYLKHCIIACSHLFCQKCQLLVRPCCLDFSIFSAGTPISRIPIMAKHPLDLYQLFNLVVERGGLLEVRDASVIVTEHVCL